MTDMISGHGYGQGYDGHRGLFDLLLSNQIGSGFRDALDATNTAAQNTILETARQGSTNLGSTERNGGEVRSSVERNGGDTRAAVERNGGEVRASIDRSFFETRNAMDRMSGDLSRDHSDIRRDVSESKAALQLQGCQDSARISAQLAECCCEIKELVRAENGNTRELIRDTDSNRLRDALAAAQQEVLIARMAGPGNS